MKNISIAILACLVVFLALGVGGFLIGHHHHACRCTTECHCSVICRCIDDMGIRCSNGCGCTVIHKAKVRLDIPPEPGT